MFEFNLDDWIVNIDDLFWMVNCYKIVEVVIENVIGLKGEFID